MRLRFLSITFVNQELYGGALSTKASGAYTATDGSNAGTLELSAASDVDHVRPGDLIQLSTGVIAYVKEINSAYTILTITKVAMLVYVCCDRIKQY